MEEIDKVEHRIFGAIKSDVDEIGIVFVSQNDVVVEDDGRKLGIPNGLIPAIKKRLASLPDGDLKSFVSLVCSGDDYTAWARRKSLVVSGEVSLMYEMRVVDIILGKQPKSGGAWEHRRFLAQRIVKGCQTSDGLQAFLDNEVIVCERVCRRHPRTYYAWAHRAWTIGWMNTEQLVNEKERIRTRVLANVSNGSAFNHLSLVLRLLTRRDSQLIIDPGKQVRVLVTELEWCSQLCQKFPGHESIWMYRRSVTKNLVDACVELLQDNTTLLKRSMQSLDVQGRIREGIRFRTYDWWALHRKDIPQLECVLQVLFDDLAYGMRLGLWDEVRPGEFNTYLTNPQKEVLNERKHALIYCGWLAEAMVKSLFSSLGSTEKKRIGPGCLSNLGIEELLRNFRAETITKADFEQFFLGLSNYFDSADLTRLFDVFDFDGSGELSRREFLAGAVVLCSGKEHGTTKIRKSFELLDTNGNGCLDEDELFAYCASVFRIVSCGNPGLFESIDIETLAKASVDDAFATVSNRKYLTCDDFCAWLQSSTTSARARPSAIENYSRLLTIVRGEFR